MFTDLNLVTRIRGRSAKLHFTLYTAALSGVHFLHYRDVT